MSKPKDRRKGNAKAASSAHAADLLGQAVPFMGFDGGFTNVFEAADNDFSGDLSSDVIIILKKLAKKDPQTREKALRELIEVVQSKSTGEMECILNYYTTVFDKLALDGSPTVRVLSLKCLSIFIVNLKKAAEKHLRKLVPFVLICSCDISNVVSGQSEDLLNTCFPNGKSAKVIQIFSGDAASVCFDMIAQKHPLCLAQNSPTRYDDEEEPLQRESRLITQALQLLSKVAVIGVESVTSVVQQLVNDVVLVKKLLKSTPAVQSGLLGLAQKMPNAAVSLTDSPLSQFVLNNLDNPEPAIGAACFNVFLLRAQEKSFYAKYDVKKTVIPKLLPIVRKKIGHWRYCGPFLLPSLAAVFEQLEGADAVGFALSYLDSFGDNMPFESAAIVPSAWSTSFAECLKYFLTKLSSSHSQDEKTQDTVIPIIVKVVDLVDSLPEDVHNDTVNLLAWICEKKALPDHLVRMLINNLQLNLLNKRPKTDALISRLLAPCLPEFALFHVDMLRNQPCASAFISVLEKASDKYLQRITKDVDVYSLVSAKERVYQQTDLVACAKVALRLLPAVAKEKLPIANNDLSLAILIEGVSSNTADWEALGIAVSGDRDFTSFIAEILKKWAVQPLCPTGRPLIPALKRLENSSRNSIIHSLVESCDHHAIEAVIKCAEEFELASEEKEVISSWLLLNYFNPAVTDTKDVVRRLQENPPAMKAVEEVVPLLLGGRHSAVFEKFGAVRSIDVRNSIHLFTERAQLLLSLDPSLYSRFLVSDEALSRFVRDIDSTFVARESASLCPLLQTDITKIDANAFTEELLEVALPLVTFYGELIGNCKDEKLVEQTAAFALVCRNAVHFSILAELRDAIFSPLDQAGRAFFTKSDDYVQHAVRCLLRSPLLTTSPFILTALRLAVDEDKNALKSALPEDASELELPLCWALKLDCSQRRVGKCERWISKYQCEDTPLEFLEHLREHVATNGDEWESVIFNVKPTEPGIWQLNVFCLQAAAHVISKYPDGVSPELLDFIMCGLASAFDTCDEVANTSGSFPNSLEYEAFLGNALQLYRSCYELNVNLRSKEKETAAFCNDWDSFFLPMLSSIILRLWSALPKEADETLSTRLLCKAVMHIPALPEDLGLPNTYTPEMDNLKYDPVLQTLITRTVEALKSGSKIRGFSAVHVLRLLSPVMYRQENGEWTDEEKVSEKGPRKVVVPFIMKELIMEDTGFVMFGAMDAALQPLKTCISSDEERLLYCDTFPGLVDRVLPPLISTCPQSLTDSQKIAYFTNENISLDDMRFIDTLEIRYPCNLLYRIIATVPAVVRTWYNGLPTSASVIVNRYVTEMVTRHIVNNELNKVKEANREATADKALKIRVIPVCREIVAEYMVEETTMRLSIEMPENYPLAVPDINLDKAIVANDRAKKWLLQLTAYLFHQNGSAVDGIRMWRKNVDRDVEGAEACTICMMTIHSNSHQLPKVKCKQCKNKFHSNCLYKWFDSSHQTSCPLCRCNFT